MSNKRLQILGEGILGASFGALLILLSPLLRAWYRGWSATSTEINRIYPGDEFVPHPKSELTCGITINAPPSAIFPWFVQLGCGRGGWYAYDLLDNGGAPSADRILPEYQTLRVGDMVSAVPNGTFGFPVARFEPYRVLSLAGTLDTKTGKPADPNDPALAAYFSGDQTFFIEPLGAELSRLIFRMRTDWNGSFLNNLIYRGILEPVSFVMGRKMLLNIKQRAESLASAPESNAPFKSGQLIRATEQ